MEMEKPMFPQQITEAAKRYEANKRGGSQNVAPPAIVSTDWLEVRRKALREILTEERGMRDAINVMRRQLTKITKERGSLQREITKESTSNARMIGGQSLRD